MDLFRSGKFPPEEMLRAVEQAVTLAWYDGLRSGVVAGLLVGVFAGIVLARVLGGNRR